MPRKPGPARKKATKGRKAGKAPPASSPGKRSLLIRDLDQLKAMSDPFRVRLLQEFASGPSTVKEVAAAVGVNQGRLYHHVAILEASGLLEVAGTRPVRGTIEKCYRAAASRFEVDGSIFSAATDSGQDPAHVEMVSNLLAQTRVELLEGQRRARRGAKGAPRPFLARMVFRGTPEEAADLVARLEELLGECCGKGRAPRADAEALEFALTVALCALGPAEPPQRS